MPEYRITGVGKSTGRKRSRVYFGVNEEAAKDAAIKDGTAPATIERVPGTPPSDNQLNYAKRLGATIPPDACADDVSLLIDQALHYKDRPNPRHLAFAKACGFEIFQYTTNQRLYGAIQIKLCKDTTKTTEMVQWFAYCLYTDKTTPGSHSPKRQCDDPLFRKVALQLTDDQKVISSIRRYHSNEERSFYADDMERPWLGDKSGRTTHAYKKTIDLLRKHGGLPPQRAKSSKGARSYSNSPKRSAKTEPTNTSNEGLAGFLVIVGFLLVLLFLIAIL